MAEQPRNKGQFVQAGMLCLFPNTTGDDASVVSHDGTLACDEVYNQADYPFLFEVIGVTFNDPGKGDDPATQFRTPPPPTWADDVNWTCRIRF